MRGVSSRVGVNVVTLLVLTAAVVGGAIVRFVGPEFFGDTYQLVVAVPEAGGVMPGMPVTVLGTDVGLIETTEVTTDAVDITMQFRDGVAVPEHVMVHVLRRSPIGEQAIELTPVPADWQPPAEVIPSRVPIAEGWAAAEPGSRLQPKAIVTPSSVPKLLHKANELLTAIPSDALNTVVDELGTAVQGRVEVLRELNRDTVDLGETLVGALPDTERLLDASGPVLAELSEHRHTLAEALTDSADVVETFAAARPTTEQIISSSTPTLRQLDGFVRQARANLSCLNDDLRDLGELTAQPDNLEEIERILDLNRFFYGGFDAGTQWDPYRPGVIWARVNILFMEKPGGQPKVPRTPTPPTLPGAACESPFGLGVNAIRQDDPVPPDPTSPGIDYAPLVEGADSTYSGGGGGDDREVQAAPRTDMPATGGGGIAVLAAGLLGGAGLLAAVRRRL